MKTNWKTHGNLLSICIRKDGTFRFLTLKHFLILKIHIIQKAPNMIARKKVKAAIMKLITRMN